MTREEAIHELFWIREDENDPKGKEALEMAIKALKQRWIPVTERLPEVGDTYIVTIEYKGKFEGVDAADFVFTGDGYIDGKWNTWNDWVEDKSEFYHVTAWIPLPDPYEEVNDDNSNDF